MDHRPLDDGAAITEQIPRIVADDPGHEVQEPYRTALVNVYSDGRVDLNPVAPLAVQYIACANESGVIILIPVYEPSIDELRQQLPTGFMDTATQFLNHYVPRLYRRQPWHRP